VSREPETEKCPRCGVASPLTDYNEVDIGVGFQRFEEQWTCPTHGDFAFCGDGGVRFRDGPETADTERPEDGPGDSGRDLRSDT
jgi:hypothetical protein